jgi:hypothetical protein
MDLGTFTLIGFISAALVAASGGTIIDAGAMLGPFVLVVAFASLLNYFSKDETPCVK